MMTPDMSRGTPFAEKGLTVLAWTLPLWLFSLAIMVEGFPRPPVTIEWARASLIMGLAAILALLILRRMPVEILAYSIFPFVLVATFDEISTTYKSPYIAACAAVLTLGIAAYALVPARRPIRVLILLMSVAIVYALAWHAAFNFWHMASQLGYVECFPDAQGCPPLTGQETPWWLLFFTP